MKTFERLQILAILGFLLTNSVNATVYTYDTLNRLTKADYGNGLVIEYSYDANGNRTARTVSSPFSPPAITAAPTDVVATIGDQVTLSVTATSNPGASYQWRKNGVPINAATSETFTIPAATVADAGSFDVEVKNPLGLATSAPVAVTISKRSQQITFNAPTTKTYGDIPFSLSASSSAALQVSLNVVSGPATFSDGMLTITGPGTIRIRASQAGNETFSAAQDVDQLISVPANFRSWRESAFTAAELADANKSGATAVYGADGYPNLIKYGLGLFPKADVGLDGPVIKSEGGNWTLTFSRPASVTDISCLVEASGDMTTWTTSGLVFERIATSNGIDTWQARYPIPASGPAFLRIKAVNSEDQSAASSPVFAGMAFTINAGTASAPTTTAFAVPLLNLPQNAGAHVGRIAGLSSTSISITNGAWTVGALGTNQAPLALRVTSGAASGYTFTVTGNTADTVSVIGASDPTTLGIAAGDTVRLIAVETLNSLFGNSTLAGGANASEADIVTISTTLQTSYYFNSTLGRWVRTTGPTTDRGNTPIPPDCMLSVTRKAGALTLKFAGMAPAVRFCQAIANSGSTYTHTGFPSDVTLGTLRMQTALPGWKSSSTAADADTLAVVVGAGFVTYFHNGNFWQRTTGPATNRDSITIPAGTPIQIFKRGTNPGSSLLTRTPPYTI